MVVSSRIRLGLVLRILKLSKVWFLFSDRKPRLIVVSVKVNSQSPVSELTKCENLEKGSIC